MAKPKIRHLALFARDPEKLASFYQRVFEMEIVARSTTSCSVFMSDGYFSLAILEHKLQAEASVGLNHFGFAVEDTAEIGRRLGEDGLEEPRARPSTRPYAEHRGCDLEGNQFDLSQHGFQDVEYTADREKKAATEKVGA